MTVYTSHRQPRHTGPAAWNAILGDQPESTPLTRNTTADIVIIGGGFAGLSAARRVNQLQPGASVILLEAGRLAEGAAGRNSGFMIDLPHDLSSENYAGQEAGSDRTLITLNRQAISFAQDAVEEFVIKPAYFDPAGKVNGAASAAEEDTHNRNYADHLATLGEASEWLDAQSMFELTGSRYYRSGLYTPGTVMLQPAGYIRGLATGLGATVRIHENSGVTAFEKKGTSWLVSASTARVTTSRIILANNGHLESFGIKRQRLMQLFLYASMTEELDDIKRTSLGGQPRWGVTPADPMGTTLRRIDTGQGGHRIITRTCATLRPDMVASKSGVERATQVQKEKFNQRFPQLAGTRMEYSWAGHLCLSTNGVSVLQEVEDGVFTACVQNGLGTTRGTLTGIGAAELACGVTSEITRHFHAEPEPAKLLPRPLSTLGANIYLRWKEWKAGNE